MKIGYARGCTKGQDLSLQVDALEQAGCQTLYFPSDPPSPTYLDQVRAAIGQDEAIFTELLHAAHRRWVIQSNAERLYPLTMWGCSCRYAWRRSLTSRTHALTTTQLSGSFRCV